MILLTAGTLGQSLLENTILRLGEVSPEELLNTLQSSSSAMTLATLALLLKAVSTCAVPIFAMLLVEGFTNTSSFKDYILRMAIAAVVSEIPFDLAMSRQFFDFHYQNPMLGMVVCLVLLYFFDRYEENTFQNVLLKIVVTAAALAWGWMLRIDDCTCLVLLTIVIWAFRNRPVYRNFIGAAVSVAFCIGSPFYLASPLGFLIIHFYNGERSENENRFLAYAAYPLMLLIVGLITKYLI